VAHRNDEAPARLSDGISVQALGRGNPAINLANGHDLQTSYVGPKDLRAALEENRAEPLSLAAADFDEDGVPDLVGDYGYQGRGIVSLLRGNVDAIYPNAPEAQQRKAAGTFTDAPFLSPASVVAAPIMVDFVGAGDFDGDSHWDLVVASRTSRALYLLSGDGHGDFGAAREIPLPGLVTALTTGEINRRDGLTDIVLGINGPEGPKLLVFEGPNGALRAQPEAFDLPAPATSLALGQLDSEYAMDLAVAAGNELLVVHGRDRKLSLDEKQQAGVPRAMSSRRLFDTPIRSIALGNFAGDGAESIAVLDDNGGVRLLSQTKAESHTAAEIDSWKSSAISSGAWPQAQLVSVHVSSSAPDDLLVVDSANQKLHILSGGTGNSTNESASSSVAASLEVAGAPVAVLALRLNGDALSDLALLSSGKSAPVLLRTQTASTFIVTNTNPSGPGSLQFAILDANETPGADLITFNIPGTAPFTINQNTPLPTITDPVTIDGTTQPGFVGTPLVALKGSGNNIDGIVISAGNSVVRGLAILNYAVSYGIRLQGNGGNVVEGNVLLPPDGSVGGVSTLGLLGGNNTVGGTSTAARNFLAQVQCRDNSGGNQVRGNYINLNVDGTTNPGGGAAIYINNSVGNIIGGTTAGTRNIIATGAFIIEGTLGGAGTGGNLVQGNYFDTNPAGTIAFSNTVNLIQVDYHSDNNTIGGTTSSARNLIAGGTQHGIVIAGSMGNQVQGNYIGTDVNGTADLGNAQNGVFMSSNYQAIGLPTSGNVIGGTAPGAGNVISGNGLSGVLVDGAQVTGNFVQGNFIGTNAAGTASLGNDLNGVTTSQAPNNTLGGPTVAARNIISANARHGVSIGIDTNSGATGITVQNNYIGTDVTGNNCLGNQRDGVFVNRGSVSHTILDNLITCNARNGVNIPNFASNDPGIRIEVTNNSIFANAVLGIDLGDPGLTANDILDTDGGANFQQNFPVLTSFTPMAPGDGGLPRNPDSPDSAVTVNATLNSTPNTTFTVHWYFSADSQCSTNQQASRPLVAGKVPGVGTDGNGNASFNFPLDFPAGISNGIINSTATDPQGNTSEFSACLPVSGSATPLPSVKLSASSYSDAESVGSMSVTVQRAGDTSVVSAVDYATSDTAGASNCNAANSGNASSRCDYETTVGTLRFAPGETSKMISIPIVDDVYAEGGESFSVTLTNASGAVLGSPSVATVTINDNDGTTGTNPFTQAGYFVRMQYLDFFSREPDTSGLNFWTNEITSCGSNTQCTEIKRINVSAAFYLSIEFRDTGYLVERIYRSAYGNGTGTSTLGGTHQFSVPVIRFEEFLPDTQEIGRGVVVGQTGWEQVLENNKQAFLNAFVQRSRFTGAFPAGMTAAQYVDALNVNAGGALSTSERNQLVNDLTTSAKTRAQVLRAVAEDADLNTAENNRAFVLMQFYGYLRRNPNDAPDADYTGYDFWLSKLNQFNGNFVNAEMVKAFIQSDEYRHRFGP
jgi:hypothetical protein